MTKNKKNEIESLPLMSPERVTRSINRMSYQIAEDNRESLDILLVGLKERGYAVAQQLYKHLRGISDTAVNLHQLKQSPNQDYLFTSSEMTNTETGGGYVVIVDDVVFSGRTMLNAITITLQHIKPTILRTVALVDRGHRIVPVEATFTGLNLPTKLDEHVKVRMKESGLDQVSITKATG